MTIDELKEQAQRVLEFGIATLRDKRDLIQMFFLVKRDSMEVVGLDPAVMSTEEGKQALAEALKNRIATETSIEAVLMLSDTYVTELNEQQRAIKQRMNMTVAECTEMGLGQRRDAVTVILESPIYARLIVQEYKWTKDGVLELVGAPDFRSTDDPAARIGGRFGSFFPQRTRAVGSEAFQ